jgi:PST family polysaccharide transporter
MASIYLGLVKMLTEFGIGTAVVTLRRLTRDEIAQLNTLSLLIGVGGICASVMAAHPLAAFFSAPELPMVIIAMSLSFIPGAARTIPYASLEKQFRFRLLGAIDASEAVVTAVSIVLLALSGFGYWSLVFGTLTGALVSTGLMLGVARQPLAWPNLAALRATMGFSADVLGARLSWYVYTHADFLVAGRMLGERALGYYSLAWTLAWAPIEKTTSVLLRLTPPFFAAVQDRPDELRRYLLNLTAGLAILAFPATVGLSLVADDFVLLVLGEKWIPIVAPLRILSVYSGFRAIAPLIAQILTAMGETRAILMINVAAACLLPLGFVVGSQAGTVGIASAWVVMHPLVILPLYLRLFRRLDLPVSTYFASLWPPLSSTLGVIGSVVAVRALLPVGPTLPARFVLEVASGAVAYALVLAAFHRKRFRALRDVASLLRPQNSERRP